MPRSRKIGPVDAHVGARIRRRRTMMGMRQTELAGRIGVSFQAVQKYETGSNRVSAALLWAIARTLDVPVGHFFEGLEDGPTAEPATKEELIALKIVPPLSMLTPELQALIVDLAHALAKAIAKP
jgi:transcriptional regulator with XRE-family HTH domain